MVYPSTELLVNILEDVTGRPFKGTPSFSKRVLRDPDLAHSFYHAHKALENATGALEAEERMFGVLATMFERHGSTIIVPVETKEQYRGPAGARLSDRELRAGYRPGGAGQGRGPQPRPSDPRLPAPVSHHTACLPD